MDFIRNKTWVPLIFLFLFVEVMLSVSFFTGKPEILFPEAAALAVGCWVFKEERWNKNPWHVCIMPTLSAVLATVLGSLPLSIVIKESAVLVLVVLILHVLKCSIGPSISAAMLPLVVGIHSWDYVAAVFVLTFVIMLGAKKNQAALQPHKKQSFCKIAYTVIIIALIASSYFLKLKAGIIPPVLVLAYEWFNKNELSRQSTIRQIVLLTFAAVAGAEFHKLLPHLTILVGLMSVMMTSLFMKMLKVKVPPALAISMLPLILGDLPVWEFPLIVFLESWVLSEAAIWYLHIESRFSLPLVNHAVPK